MQETFEVISRNLGEASACPDFLCGEQARKVRAFHSTFPMYVPTPMAHLPQTAAFLGLGDLYVKDESHRFGLNAFKVLGGSYAIGSWLAERLGMEQVSYDRLVAPETAARLGDVTFVTATDGNHGRGVAWTAAQLGRKAVVYMPWGTAPERVANIRALGAEVTVIDGNYDAAVALAAQMAAANGWVLVQDTDREGSAEMAARIMQGYGTMGLEAWEQLPQPPTHVFLQAGVGSMAAAVAALLCDLYRDAPPIIVIVEPNGADCLLRTARADDGRLHGVDGHLDTIMAGLACGQPCALAWQVLEGCARHFVACPDAAAALGMRMLGNPLGADDRVISGESGASAFGCMAAILLDARLTHLRERLALDETSRVLCFSTEGATDRENYRNIVWAGKYPMEG